MYNNFTPISGCLSVDCVFNIIQQFNQNKITYSEAKEIIYLLSEQLKFQQEYFCNKIENTNNIVVHYKPNFIISQKL